ncbi:MAG: RNA-directed DNA polymerase [Bacteroidota bacterium]|nr:RNA-directed DNA polymerase [Bacteroidota bacterium]
MNITLTNVKEAYQQLKRHLYYERLDLDARHRIVQFESGYNFDIDGRLKTVEHWIKKFSNSEGVGRSVKKLVESIDINVFVKKVLRESDDNTSNFITDRIHTDNFKLEKENAFVSIPVELQILGTLWLNSIGAKIDKNLINHCYGNRLIKRDNEQDLQLNGRLFKIYHFQYARWWKTGLAKAKAILRKDKEDVVMLNFDLKSFYHSTCVDKNVLRTRVKYEKLSKHEKFLHRVLENVLEMYNNKLKIYNLNKNLEGWALPIGYIASPIIANDYLSGFDNDIVKNVRPSYYGRYVDDILVVFKSGTPKEDDAKTVDQKLIPELNKLDKNDEAREAVYRFIKYLGDRFNIIKTNDDIRIEIKGTKGAELQLEKLFVYELDKRSPSNLIESFIQDQHSKSYEFQFESEENDNVSKEFGNLLFTQSFEKEEASRAKIKPINQNKFEISVFLSRLIRRSTSSDKYTHRIQLQNVISYYKGANCIEKLDIVGENYSGHSRK